MPTGLTEDQRSQFDRDGFLILPEVFTPAEVERMRGEADAILELILNSSIANRRKSGRLDWLLFRDGVQHVRKIQPVNDLSLFLSQVSEDPRLLNPMRAIMGCDPLLMEEKLNYKQPLPERVEGVPISEGEDAFVIHNDWAHYRGNGYPQDILSSAISMDACTPDNGPLHVWPGSHHTHIDHLRKEFHRPDGTKRYDLTVPEGTVDPEGGIDVLVPAGSVMIFHALLIHSSRSNETPGPRRLMIYSHYPSRIEMPFDTRNGPTRLREAPWEHEYLRLRAKGVYTDRFRAPGSATT